MHPSLTILESDTSMTGIFQVQVTFQVHKMFTFIFEKSYLWKCPSPYGER